MAQIAHKMSKHCFRLGLCPRPHDAPQTLYSAGGLDRGLNFYHYLHRHFTSSVPSLQIKFLYRHCIKHDASANKSNSTKSDIIYYTKQRDILLKIAMKMPINRRYYSVHVLHVHGASHRL